MTEAATGTAATNGEWVPPYISFTSLMNLISRMAQQGGVPDHIARRWIGGSGTNQSQMTSALKALGLRDDDGTPLDPLRELVSKPDERERLVRELLERYYSGPVQLGKRNGTQEQLLAWFKDRKLSTETARKAATFYLQAADFAKVPISPYFSKTRSGPAKPRAASRRNPTPASAQNGGNGGADGRTGASADTPPPPPSSTEAFKARYLEGLLKRAEEGEVDEALLNRIERLLGFPEVQDVESGQDER